MEQHQEQATDTVGKIMALYGAAPDTVTMMRRELPIDQYLAAIDLLRELGIDMTVRLACLCPVCRHCAEDCYYRNYAEERLQEGEGEEREADLLIPANLLEEAGIDPHCRLEATVADGEIIFYAATPGIEDMPLFLLGSLYEAGVCLFALDKMIATGEVIGNE